METVAILQVIALHNLPKLMQGEIDQMLTAVHTYFQAEQLKQQVGAPA